MNTPTDCVMVKQQQQVWVTVLSGPFLNGNFLHVPTCVQKVFFKLAVEKNLIHR